MIKPLSKPVLRELLSFAEKTATGAGAILKRGFARPGRVTYKGRIDPVTEFDLKSERFIVSQIEKKYPEHAILTEEGSSVGEVSACRWIVDPLDGTVNYAHGFPVYCVSIGFEYAGLPLIGVVFDPERMEMFSGARSLGAFLNGKRIRVSAEKELKRSLLATGFGYNIGTARRNNLGLFARMAKKAQAIRRPGSAAIDICWLAAGRLDGFWEFYLHPWDTAAAIVLVEEAGGKVTRLDGRSYSIFDRELLVTNSHLHEPMQRALRHR